MKVVAIIQARMGSTRLPGKVLMDLGGKPVLGWVYRACAHAPGVDEVWIATSTQPADDAISEWCRKNGIRSWRGSETDVLGRFAGTVAACDADIVLRLTGDCPFLDPQVIGGVVRLMKMTGADFSQLPFTTLLPHVGSSPIISPFSAAFAITQSTYL